MKKMLDQSSDLDRVRAWAVHIFTASGALAGLMSLIHIFQGDAAGALIWLGVALVIDTLDGPLARRYSIDKALPQVDGAILDHVIDYTTYALIPAIFLYYFDFMPEGWAFPAAGLILVTSLYCFANKSLKTNDNFFSGFPATWNLVVLCFYILQTPATLNLIVVLVCAALTFVPVKFVHPFRVRALRPLTMALTFVWAGLALYLVLERGANSNLASSDPLAYWGFILVSIYFLLISFWRSIRGKLDFG